MSKNIISNHEQALECAHNACHNPIWISDEAALAAALHQWKQCGLLGIDTEFIRESTYYPRLALIQVSDGHQVWLIDSVKLNDHKILAEILTNHSVVKILHSPREDLEVLRQSTGAVPEPLFDTQAAAALCGESLQSSYSALLESTIGVQLDKEMARSDWLQRPLSDAQIGYACRDVAYLPLVAHTLKQQLQALQRWEWFEQDMRWLLSDSAESTASSDLYLALPGAARLDNEALKALQALCEWREATARQRDLPRQFVLRNEAVLRLAQQPPQTKEALFQINGIRASQARRYGADILAVLSTTAQRAIPPPVPQLDSAQQQRIKKAQKWVRQQAAELNLEPAVLASRRELERWLKDGLDQVPSRLRGWRWTHIGEPVSQILQEQP